MVVLFLVRMAGTSSFTLSCTALNQFLVLRACGAARSITVHSGIRMDVDAPVHPGSFPPHIVDKHGVFTPPDARSAPSPGTKPGADSDAESKTNRAAHKKSRARSREHDERVVGRHHDKARIDRLNGDIRTARHNDLAVRTQIAEVPSLLTHPLHGVHNVGALREHRG